MYEARSLYFDASIISVTVYLAADMNLYEFNDSRYVHSQKLCSHEAPRTALHPNQDSLTIFFASTLLLLYPSNWRETSLLVVVCQCWDSISDAPLWDLSPLYC